jgi:anti-sigma regulatory factor (Ser/Thr protein kinase)
MTDGHRATTAIAPSDASVAPARKFVVESASDLDWFDPQRIEELELLVSEVVTNAVSAQARVGASAAIEIECVTNSAEFVLMVRDHAGGFDFGDRLAVPEPTLSREGGFGLAIIVSLSDEVEFRPCGAGTEVRLILRPRNGRSERLPRPAG